jgi:hypothetical protein
MCGGNVGADLLQHLNRLGMGEAGGFRPCAVHVNEIAGGSTKDGFSHVAAAGIPSEEGEDVGFHDDLIELLQIFENRSGILSNLSVLYLGYAFQVPAEFGRLLK